jgi:hypothetical protein
MRTPLQSLVTTKAACCTLGIALLAAPACTRLERFDNSDGSAYCGNIVGAEFVREGFATLPRMQLQLDMQSLDRFPGRMTSDDAVDGPCRPQATFDAARLRVSGKLQADALSQLEFGDQRELNLVAWVDSSCDGTYLAVVSLLENDDVEVRLMRSQANEDAEEAGPFGVFKLTRHPRKCGF